MKFSQIAPQPEQTQAQIPTLEAIDYQINDSFGPDLEVIIGKFVEMVEKETPSKYIEGNKELKDEFNQLVLKRLGLNVYLITDTILAATMPNVYNPYNIVNQDELKDALTGEYNSIMGSGLLYNKQSGFKMGYIDNSKAKVSGWFSEQSVPVFLNFIDLVNSCQLTVSEITAVLLHELGHVYEGAALCARTVATNQTLAEASRRAIDMKPNERQEYIYQELKKLNKEIKKEDIEGVSSSNSVVLGVSMFRAILASVESLTDSRHDRTTYESLSDSFATRFGYGEQIATGLDKLINRADRKISYVLLSVLKVYFLYHDIIGIVRILSLLISTNKIAFSTLLNLIQKIIAVVFITNSERENTRDMTYDLDKDRFIRVRNNLVGLLKNTSIDNKTRKATLEQIKTLDGIIDKSWNFRGIIGQLSIMISPVDRRTYKAIQAQQELEKMIANEIFVNASKLQSQ